jgi:hypothetical protein
MADLVREVVDYVAANSDFTVDVDLFDGYFPPEKADTAVAIIDAPGVAEGVAPLRTVGQYTIQVLSRAFSRPTAKTNAATIQALLHGMAVVVLGEWTVHYGQASQSAYPLGHDTRRRWEFTQHFVLRATS